MQDITAAVMIGIVDFQQKCKFSTWVHEIALRKTAEVKRKLGRERKAFDKSMKVIEEPHFDAYAEYAPKPRQVIATQAPDWLDEIEFEDDFSTLNKKDAELLLYRLEGLSNGEIAKKIGVSTEAVESRWARLKAKIKKNFFGSDGNSRFAATE